MNEKDHIVSLIAKQLQGLATPQELADLQQWLQSDTACQQEFDDMAVIWQKSGRLLAEPQFNADIAWAKLDDQIAQLTARDKKPFHLIISGFFSSTSKAAAVILIVAGMAAGGYWWQRSSQWQSFTAVAQNENITLPDQSVVTVRKGSTLQYLKHFDKKERRVKLTGEAFFTVQHNEHQPFLVITDHAEVKVLGTSFLVHSTDADDEVVVVTGKVNVADKKEHNNQVYLTKGQRAVLKQDHHFYQDQVADTNFLAWRSGQLNFNNTALPQVLQDISHYYGIIVDLDPSLPNSANTIPVTVHFNNQPLEQVLEELKLITGFQVKKEKDKMLFYRN
ncbi:MULTISPECIES: FecR family protein [Niastella]|uniref:FecR domain-containing protein n=1 Tax=Niastella soli TaxID=2821487 RepID=A0ABS3YYW7_9BACT|nr:FecR family protein [Niastella soli]MBO9203122.1 FecR domain-containing protein [Niastella soli]